MTDEERAELALAVGRRVRPVGFYDCGTHATIDVARWAGGVTTRPYDPTVPGEDSAKALRWLWERSHRVAIYRRGKKWAVECRPRPIELVVPPVIADTPEEAVARIIAAWPDGTGSG